MFVGDAVAMPVHWYYDVPAIKRDFDGWISKYERPKNKHPTSILRVSNKGKMDTRENEGVMCINKDDTERTVSMLGLA